MKLFLFTSSICVLSCTSTKNTNHLSYKEFEEAEDRFLKLKNVGSYYTPEYDTLFIPLTSLGMQICDNWDFYQNKEEMPVFVFVPAKEIEEMWWKRNGEKVYCVR